MSPHSPRSINPKSLGGTALIAGLVIGSVVVTVFLCAYFVKRKRQKAQTLEDEQIRRHEAEVIELEAQRAAWEAHFDRGDIPSDLSKRYEDDFRMIKIEEGEDEGQLNLMHRDDDNVLPDDSVTFVEGRAPMTQRRNALLKEERRYLMGRWWAEHKFSKYTNPTKQDVESQQTGPRWHNRREEILLEELLPPGPSYHIDNSPPRGPVKSNSSPTAPQFDHNVPVGHGTNRLAYLAGLGPRSNNPHATQGINNLEPSSFLTVPDQSTRNSTPSAKGTLKSTFTMPEGYDDIDSTRDRANRYSTSGETDITNDVYGSEARRNYREGLQRR